MAKSAILRTSLDVLYYTGASQVLRGIFGGRGAIFMLHHVRPGGGSGRGFAPNAGLEVTPEFLDQVIALVKSRGFDLVGLDEVAGRLGGQMPAARPFAAFTLDDGYRDNLVHALPVFRRNRCPFTIYVAPAIADGTCELWWRGLEAAIAGETRIETAVAGDQFALDTASDAQKQQAWQQLYWPVRQLEPHRQRQWIRDFCGSRGVNLEAICRAAAMTWDELRFIASDPLCTIGAHTINHYAVGQLSDTEALAELTGSAERIADELGRRPRHFAYPYGDADSAGRRDFRLAAEAGFVTAVTTRKGLVFDAHGEHLMALPRVSLSGEYQKLRYVEVLLSGTALALINGFRRLNVA
ncbi:MAG: polysaccharide deacetylase family protein [Rhizobiales bacterium]|nr:polysaccharide deacetylase family protein [Hyphomicrobiales bacterium]MBI3673092.1 polysaccharide deacetylase family protein [Hyphomicrobiales bacterium]